MAWVLPAWLISFIVLAVLVYYRRWLYVAIKTAPRDLRALFHYLRMLYLARQMEKDNCAVADMFHSNVLKCPDKKCFLMNDEFWTFKQVEEFSLRVSAVLRHKGLKKDGVVCLMMSNCPEYPATWLGVTRLGAVAALLNTNQTGKTLIHSINVVKCDMIIYGDEYENVLNEIKKDLSPSIIFLKFTHRPLNTSSDAEPSEAGDDFTFMLERTPTSPWFRAEGDGIRGKLLYIYTSGTTGLPKAAVLSSQKVLNMAAGIRYIGGVKPDQDVVYCPMPLYHSAGGCIAIGLALVFGCTVALRKKFSASAYFKDCIKYNATVAQYIGEMCRYILATPPSPTDIQHKVRNIFGNGLRPTIWPDFVKRFNIKHVAEFYGATESNASILNPDNTTGAIGFLSRILPRFYPINLIKVDQETGEPIRDAKGMCQLAEPNEPGVFVSKIDQNKPFGAYLGYMDKEASEKKIIRDVFEFGDVAFLSGDILVADELGYLYFRDRTGDTFRWRGENVSTTEVEAAISRVADHRDVVVYGVEIPNIEGRAGMCGIMDPDDTLDLDQLLKDISKDLPKYARPIFIRKLRSLDQTGTFKIKKMDLQKEGYDPNKVSDKLYYLDPTFDKYLLLGPEDYDRIISGQVRL